MQAIGFNKPGDINVLVNIEQPTPTPEGRDLLIEIKAVSVNPVDVKVRQSAKIEPSQWKVLGWDAAGIVTAIGPDVTLFQPGDEVFYAGAIDRPGTNAEYHLVDERIVGIKPKTIDWAGAAALPLTAITAAAKAIVIIGGAGGVGSIAIQMARKLTVIATASRPETIAWVKEMGAHHIIDHTLSLA